MVEEVKNGVLTTTVADTNIAEGMIISVADTECPVNAVVFDSYTGRLLHRNGRVRYSRRDIIILRFNSGKTLREISSQMGISYAYVKVLQNKAFEKMKRYFENQ